MLPTVPLTGAVAALVVENTFSNASAVAVPRVNQLEPNCTCHEVLMPFW